MKKKVLIIVGIILALCLYFGSKFFLFHYYNLNTYDIKMDKLNIGDIITISTKTSEDYFQFENIKLNSKLLDGFEELKIHKSENSKGLVKYLDNQKIAHITVGYDNTIVSSCEENIEDIYSDIKASSKYMQKYFKNHSIENDVDLIEYLVNEGKKNKVSMFSSYSKLKDNHVTLELANQLLNTEEDINLITGDYTGYAYNLLGGNVKEVNISYNNKRYIIQFLNLDYFTDEMILEVLNSLIIE